MTDLAKREYTPKQPEYHQLCAACKHRRVMHVNDKFIHDGQCSVSGCRCPFFHVGKEGESDR
jgi:hypothetical protein